MLTFSEYYLFQKFAIYLSFLLISCTRLRENSSKTGRNLLEFCILSENSIKYIKLFSAIYCMLFFLLNRDLNLFTRSKMSSH